ncbi:hypothetical protein E1B28_013301 [Marasmius oreades]|uniref:FHA domain-containing protein n=1 Tax=Marasmius oreades TaxID=181124 RepID=A0A9P7RPF6_9AGAR|nr:uncharacterized protein E1B28_013301 [Marasmius oreades]KAG7087324.1 hypothetical protein E1B28_013301 [Marasmius oreades]
MFDDDIEYIGSSHRERSADIQMTGSSRALTGFALNVEGAATEFKRRMVFGNLEDLKADGNRVIVVGRSPPPSGSTGGSWFQRNGVGNAMFRCPVVSRKHAKFHFEQDNKLFVTDTNSHHGTHIRRHGSLTSTMLKPETPTQLFDGDVITFGKTVGRNGELVRPVVVRLELLLKERPVNPQRHANTSFLLADDSNDTPSTSPKSTSSGRYGVFCSSSSSSEHSSDEMEISSSGEQSEAEEALPPSIALPPTSIVGKATGAIKRLMDGGTLPSITYVQGGHTNKPQGPPPPLTRPPSQPPAFVFGSPATQAAGSNFTFSVPSFFSSTPPTAEGESRPQAEPYSFGCRLPPLWFQSDTPGSSNANPPSPPIVSWNESGIMNSANDSPSARFRPLGRMQNSSEFKSFFSLKGFSSSALRVRESILNSKATSAMSAMDLSTPSPPPLATDANDLEKEASSRSSSEESQSSSTSEKDNHASESIQCAQQRDADDSPTFPPPTSYEDSPHDAHDLWNAAHPYTPLPRIPAGWGAGFDPWGNIEESLPSPTPETDPVTEDGVDACGGEETKGREEVVVVDEETGFDNDEDEQEEQEEPEAADEDVQDEARNSIESNDAEEIQKLNASLDKFSAETNVMLSGIDRQMDRFDRELKDISKAKVDNFTRLDNKVNDVAMSVDALSADVTDVKATCNELETSVSLLRVMGDSYPIMVNDVKMDVDEMQSRVVQIEDRMDEEQWAHDGAWEILRERADEGNRLVKDLKDMFNEMHSSRESHRREMKEARTDLEREIRYVSEIKERMERAELEMKAKVATAAVVHDADSIMATLPPSPLPPTQTRTVISLKRKYGEDENDTEIESSVRKWKALEVLGGTNVDGVKPSTITGFIDDFPEPTTHIPVPDSSTHPTTTLTPAAGGVQVPCRKRSRVVIRLAQTATAITVGAVVTWTALAFT